MKQFPKKVKIGTKYWKVLLVNHLEEDFGSCSDKTCEILINKNIDEYSKRTTLLHEVLHACCRFAGVNADNDATFTEEQFVTNLEHPLYTVLKENPDLIA